MGNKDPRVDAYINKAQDFTRPVLNYIRGVVHKACPTVEEKIKWDFPHVDYINEMMMSMAVFKKHCTLGFWKATLINKPKGLLKKKKIQQ